MDVEFKDPHLQALMTDEVAHMSLPISVISSARKKIQFLQSAPDETSLRNWKSLHYEKLHGDREGQRSIRLNLKWRLVFEIDIEPNPPKITIIEIVDYHD